MKSVRTAVVAAVVIVAAVAGTVVWKTQQDSNSEGSGSSRQRNTTFVATTVDTAWGQQGFSLMSQPTNINVTDMDSLADGTTYSVGTMATEKGPRAVVFRTKDGKSYDVKYAINPLKETLGSLGDIAMSTGQKISVDGSGNVWVVLNATTTINSNTYSVITQLKPTLEYWSTPASSVCLVVCGSVYNTPIKVLDIQVNSPGNRVLVATSNGMDLFNSTAGRPLPLGTMSISNGPNANNCGTNPTHLADAPGSSAFLAVGPVSRTNNVVLVNYSGLIKSCTLTFEVTSISSVSVVNDTAVVYGRFFDDVSFTSYDVLGDYVFWNQSETVDVQEQTEGSDYVTGQALAWSWARAYGAFTVQGKAPRTYVVEFDIDNSRISVFSSLDNKATGAVSSDQPPLIARTGTTMTLASPYTDKSALSTALAVRFKVGWDGLLTAPTFAATEQNMTVTYGQQTSVPFARATNAASYSLAGGSFPAGMSLTSSGEIIGSPQSVGYYTARISATNPAGSATTTLYINSAAKTPGAPTILGVNYGSPVSVIGYLEGLRGSDKDVVSAHFTDKDGNTINQQCLNGACLIFERDLPENVDVTVNLTQSNSKATTDSFNTIVIRRSVLPEPVTQVVVKGGSLKAIARYTASADMHGMDALSYVATLKDPTDGGVVETFWGCSPTECDMEGVPEGRYTLTITIITEAGNVESDPSPQFVVGGAVPERTEPLLATEDLTVPAHEDFVLPLVAAGKGDIKFDVNYEDLPGGTTFDEETNSIVGATNPGTYVVGYSATDQNGTAEGTVTITVTPSQLRAPGLLPAYSTYDRKFSVHPFYKRNSDMWAVDHFEWSSTVTVNGVESTKTGSCSPDSRCTLPNAQWGQDLTLTLTAIPLEESGDTASETSTFIVHVPDLPPAVPTGKIILERMPDTSGDTAVLMGHVRMKPSMKFPLTLGAAATVQIDATTSCDVVDDQVVLRLEGPRNGCSVDPFLRVLAGEEVIGVDDDGGIASILSGTDENGNERHDTYNMLSSRLGIQLEPGEYTIEATSFSDQYKNDVERADEADSEYDLWLTIITTPAEADRLVKVETVGTAFTENTERITKVASDPAKAVEVPADLAPAASNALPQPTQGQKMSPSAVAVVSLNVTAGSKELTVSPNTLGNEKSAQVTVTANPGGRTCSADVGNSCTITGLSPWVTYSLTATTGKSTATATGTPQLQWKAKSKVKVSSLGLSAAAKALSVGLKKGSIKVSGSCTINSARTTISVGAAGSCTIVSGTTKKVKATTVNGPTLSATAIIK